MLFSLPYLLLSPTPLVSTLALAQSLSASQGSDPTTQFPSKPTPEQSPTDCQRTTASSQIDGLANRFVQIADWANQPEMSMKMLIERIGPLVFASLNPTRWPQIHEQARLARVPVITYHDILLQKQALSDVTPEELESHLQRIQAKGLTPISLDRLVSHLRTGLPLPAKPILLSFDDGYSSHYQYVYPLLKKYSYPATFSIHTDSVGQTTDGSHITWKELRQMAADPLVTVASYSVARPPDLRQLPDDKLQTEVVESKRILEAKLGVPIRYFTYPEGKYDARVANAVQMAGYQAALTMDDLEERFAGQSESLLAIGRMDQLNLEQAIAQAWGGPRLPSWNDGFDFTTAVERTQITINKTPLILIAGGRPVTIHAKSRYQVPEILAGTPAVAAVDGGFFSMKYLDSNVMIGPVLSQSDNRFTPGETGENLKSAGRPLVLMSPEGVIFTPFDPTKHNTLAGIQAEMPQVTDAFIAAAWLVKNSQPQPARTFGKLFDFDAVRHRAFWGINQAGQPTIGVTKQPLGSVALGVALAKAGFRDAVMLDSGGSTSLAYRGESLVEYVPRPVPHVVALVPPPPTTNPACVVAPIKNQAAEELPG